MNPTNLSPVTNGQAAYPVGVIDFNKPFQVKDVFSDKIVENSTIIRILNGNSYPVAIVFNDGSEDIVETFDTDGDSLTGDFVVVNTPVGPQKRYIAILNDDGALYPASELFDSESAARNEHSDAIQIVEFVLNSEDEEADTGSQIVDDVTVNGRQFKAGDRVSAYRRGYGERQFTVVKVRDDSKRSLYIKSDYDSSKPYWALNSNIR